jgi:hypothetical protein
MRSRADSRSAGDGSKGERIYGALLDRGLDVAGRGHRLDLENQVADRELCLGDRVDQFTPR